MTYRDPALRIALDPKKKGNIAGRLTNSVLRETEIIAVTSRQRLGEVRDSLADALHSIQRQLGTEKDIEDFDALNRAFISLRRLSRELQDALLDGDLRKMPRLREHFEAALLPARRRHSPAVIQLSGPEDQGFPLEFISNLEPNRWPASIQNKTHVVQACRSFIGFAAVVQREARTKEYSTISQDRRLINDPKLPIAIFSHAKLQRAREEADYLGSRPQEFELRDQWQGCSGGDDDNLADLARALYYAGFTAGTLPDQVQHFACHCQGNAQPRLVVTAGSREVPIPLSDLKDEFGKILEKAYEPPSFSLPLIFINACSSAEGGIGSAKSFPDFFLNYGYRGFIGTETTVPDALAGALAIEFYRELLKGKPVGVALWYAKMRMVARHNNPLGLLYTVYADQDLKVERKVAAM